MDGSIRPAERRKPQLRLSLLVHVVKIKHDSALRHSSTPFYPSAMPESSCNDRQRASNAAEGPSIFPCTSLALKQNRKVRNVTNESHPMVPHLSLKGEQQQRLPSAKR